MMESVALTESHMIVDDDDFVLVQADDMDVDEDSYDNCDEELVSRLSPVPSMSASFCMEINDLDVLIEETGASIVSLEKDNAESRDDFVSNSNVIPNLDSSCADSAQPEAKAMEEGSSVAPKDDIGKVEDVRAEAPMESGDDCEKAAADPPTVPPTKSRMSNKKRRKKVKMLKKAAASAAAAAALEEMNKSAPPPAPSTKPKKKAKNNKPKKKSQVTNLAVVCATESLSQYRLEQGLQKEKTATNYVALL